MDDDVNYDPMAPKKVNLKLDRSELVLGGINQAQYSGCVEFSLADVQVGGESMIVIRESGMEDDDDVSGMDDDDDDFVRTRAGRDLKQIKITTLRFPIHSWINIIKKYIT